MRARSQLRASVSADGIDSGQHVVADPLPNPYAVTARYCLAWIIGTARARGASLETSEAPEPWSVRSRHLGVSNRDPLSLREFTM